MSVARGRACTAAGKDQGIFTDALESAGVGEHIYPYTYLQAPNNKAWNGSVLNWPHPEAPRESLWMLHRVGWKSGSNGTEAVTLGRAQVELVVDGIFAESTQ